MLELSLLTVFVIPDLIRNPVSFIDLKFKTLNIINDFCNYFYIFGQIAESRQHTIIIWETDPIKMSTIK